MGNIQIGLLLSLLIACLVLVSCKTTTGSNDSLPINKITVYDARSVELAVINAESDLNNIYQAWQKRERRYEKLLPLFEYKFKVKIDNEVQTWRFNKGGYLMQEGSTKLYKMKMNDLSKFI